MSTSQGRSADKIVVQGQKQQITSRNELIEQASSGERSRERHRTEIPDYGVSAAYPNQPQRLGTTRSSNERDYQYNDHMSQIVGPTLLQERRPQDPAAIYGDSSARPDSIGPFNTG